MHIHFQSCIANLGWFHTILAFIWHLLIYDRSVVDYVHSVDRCFEKFVKLDSLQCYNKRRKRFQKWNFCSLRINSRIYEMNFKQLAFLAVEVRLYKLNIIILLFLFFSFHSYMFIHYIILSYQDFRFGGMAKNCKMIISCLNFFIQLFITNLQHNVLVQNRSISFLYLFNKFRLVMNVILQMLHTAFLILKSCPRELF